MPMWAKLLLGIGGGAAAIAIMVFVASGLQKTSCEVCVDWNGKQQCATTTGEDVDAAFRSAMTTACAPVGGDARDTTKCEHSTPTVRNCSAP